MLERIPSTPSTPKATRHAPHSPAPPSFSSSGSTSTLPAQASKQDRLMGGAKSPPAGAHVTQSPKHGATITGHGAADSASEKSSSSGVASAQPSVSQSPSAYRPPPSAGGGMRMMGAVVHDRGPARGPPPPSQRCMTRRTSVKDDIEIPNAIDNNLRLADDSDISRTNNNADKYVLEITIWFYSRGI